jgi:hypothetical protein
VSQAAKVRNLLTVNWRTACVAQQKPDVVKTLKAYKALIFCYFLIKQKVREIIYKI